MIYIICGLPGTGKTTLCKKLSQIFGCEYQNDWNIFTKQNIKIDKFEDKNLISKKHSVHLFNFIEENKRKNLVLDLEYSISPTDFKENKINEFCKIIYLGFVKLSNKILVNQFKKSAANINKTDDKLLKMISFYKKMSVDYQNQCKKQELIFVDINKSRGEIIKSLIKQLTN